MFWGGKYCVWGRSFSPTPPSRKNPDMVVHISSTSFIVIKQDQPKPVFKSKCSHYQTV